jgi:hypothetical protein
MKATKMKKSFNDFKAAVVSGMIAAQTLPMRVFADDPAFTKVAINEGEKSSSDLMGSVIGLILGITQYVGIALIVFGVYEVVMSFMNDQPEKKVKGITIALAGVLCATLKSILTTMGIIGG